MYSEDPATEAFIRYLRHELDVMGAPIEAGCQDVPDCEGQTVPEIVRSALRSIAGYFVRMSGAMTSPTSAFWRDISECFQSQFGALPPVDHSDEEFFAAALEASGPSHADQPGLIELGVLQGVRSFDREHNTAYLARLKMFIWRFAAALVAADREGTLDEETALDVFKKYLEVETGAAPEASSAEPY